MKRSDFLRLAFGATAALGGTLAGTGNSSALSPGAPLADVPARARNRSLQLEIEHAIDKGLAF